MSIAVERVGEARRGTRRAGPDEDDGLVERLVAEHGRVDVVRRASVATAATNASCSGRPSVAWAFAKKLKPALSTCGRRAAAVVARTGRGAASAAARSPRAARRPRRSPCEYASWCMSRRTWKWWRRAMSSTASTFAKNASLYASGCGSSALQLIVQAHDVEAELFELLRARFVEVGEVSFGARPSSKVTSKTPLHLRVVPAEEELPARAVAEDARRRTSTCTAAGLVRPGVVPGCESLGPHASATTAMTKARLMPTRT